MRDKLGSALAVSPDAASVRFGLADREEKPVVFDLAAASLIDSANLPAGFASARVRRPSHHGLGERLCAEVQRREPCPRQLRKVPRLGDPAGRVAVSPSEPNGLCALTTRRGKERWNHAGPGIAWGVDFSADGEIVVVAYGDGTIRWLRWSDGEELLALFVEPQTRKWVAWTPSGYYMASAGGEDLIGWHVNRGWEQEADFFPASQFRAQYNRPDIVKPSAEDEGRSGGRSASQSRVRADH